MTRGVMLDCELCRPYTPLHWYRARFPWRPTPVNPMGVTGVRCVPSRGVWARSDRDGIDWGL